MTKTLILMRHLKSGWDDPALADHDRPLAQRGIDDGPAVRAALAARLPRPDAVLCSTARRTRETLKAVLPEIPETAVDYAAQVYEASAQTLMRLAATLPEDAETALIVGHNPGLFDLAWTLARRSEAAAHPGLTRFPTGATVGFALPISAWSEIGPGRAAILACFSPKSLVNPG